VPLPLVFLVIVNVGIVAGAVIQCVGHLGFRPGVFFGVTVDPEFSRTEDAQRILWRYRRPIIVVAVLCSAALWLVVSHLKGVAAPLACSALIFVSVRVGGHVGVHLITAGVTGIVVSPLWPPDRVPAAHDAFDRGAHAGA
jgi:hypothetical protein